MTAPKKNKREYQEHRVAESLNKEWGYVRIGLYVLSRKFGHENISDIHLIFPRDPKYPGHNKDPRSVKSLGMLARAYFTGPNSSIYDLQSPKRSLREMRNYEDYREVDSDREMEQGGQALVFEAGNYPHTRPKAFVPSNKFHVWILGPLLLNDRPYGSLLLELTGPLRRDRVFRKIVLHSSTYSEGAANFIPGYTTRAPDMQWEDYVVETYTRRLQGVTPVSLPPGALRWEWTVETVSANVTAARAIKMSG